MAKLSALRLFRRATAVFTVIGLALVAAGAVLLLAPRGLTPALRVLLGAAGAITLLVALDLPVRGGFSRLMLPVEIKAALRVNGTCAAAAGLCLLAAALAGGGLALGAAVAACGALAICAAWLGFFRLSTRLPATFTAKEMLRIARSAGILGAAEESVANREFRRWTGGAVAGVAVGATAPDGPVVTLEGEERTLAAELAALGAKTVVLNLGSYSCPHHRKRVGELHALLDRFAPRGVGFLTVYIAEAHPEDGWRLEGQYENDEEYTGRPEDFCFDAPRNIEERLRMARWLVDKKQLRMPVLVDTLEDTLLRAYNAWPIRLYVLHEGRVAYCGEQGPFGYVPAALEDTLARLAPEAPRASRAV